MSQLISVKEARKLLGKDCVDMTNDQVEVLIDNLSVIAREAIKTAQDKITQDKENERHLIELASFLYSRYIFAKTRQKQEKQ